MKKTVKNKLVTKMVSVITCAVVLCTSLVGCGLEDVFTSSTENTESTEADFVTIGEILKDGQKKTKTFTVGTEYKVLDVHYIGADHIFLILALEDVKDHTRTAYERELHGFSKNDYMYESIVKGDTIKFTEKSVEIIKSADDTEDKETDQKAEKVEQQK